MRTTSKASYAVAPKAPHEDILEIFVSALSSDNPTAAEVVWDQYPLLQDWYQGRTVTLNSHEGLMTHTITPGGAVYCFQLAVDHRQTVAVKLWDKHPALRAWYSGQPINMGSIAKPLVQVISKQDLLDTLLAVSEIRQSNCASIQQIHLLNDDALTQFIISAITINNSRFKALLEIAGTQSILLSVLKKITSLYKNKTMEANVRINLVALQDYLDKIILINNGNKKRKTVTFEVDKSKQAFIEMFGPKPNDNDIEIIPEEDMLPLPKSRPEADDDMLLLRPASPSFFKPYVDTDPKYYQFEPDDKGGLFFK